jgi:AcrR family transcriptional regulator
MALTRTPRHAWIDAGMRALASGGPDAVRIEPLARELGVTKGGFYWHFDGRRALLDEVLDAWESRSITDVIDRVEEDGGDGRAKLRRLFGMAGASGELLSVDLAVRDWSRRDPAVARRLRRADNRRMEYMRPLFAEFAGDADEVEVRCMLSVSLWIGNHFMAADHEGRSRRHVLALTVERLLAD